MELGNYIAAPTAGRMLADFGAGSHQGRAAWHRRRGTQLAVVLRLLRRCSTGHMNRNKKSIVLDLKTDAGRTTVLDLVRHCDVLLENFRPGTLEKWGLGPQQLEQINPNLVIVRISAFGQTGPLSQRPGFAAVAEAAGGMRELVGEPDRPPSRVGVSIGDSIAGIYAAFGAVMALFERERKNVPSQRRIVDVALNESILSVMESLVPDYLAYGVVRERVGGRMEGIAPSNAYPCSDGTSIIIAGNGDSIYQRYMQTIGRPDLAADPALQSNAGRWQRRDELDTAIGEWTIQRTRERP